MVTKHALAPMRRFVIALITVTPVFLFLGSETGMGKTLKKLTPEDRSTISRLTIQIEHNNTLERHNPLVFCRIVPVLVGKTARGGALTREQQICDFPGEGIPDCTKEEYKEMQTQNLEHTARFLQPVFDNDDDLRHSIRKQLDDPSLQTGRITIVENEEAPFILSISLDYVVKANKFYSRLYAEITNSDKSNVLMSTVYFSSDWKQNKYQNDLNKWKQDNLGFVMKSLKKLWKDIDKR